MMAKPAEPPARADEQGSEAFARPERRTRKSTVSWMATTIVLASLGLALLLLTGIYRFGSSASALAYLRGDILIPNAYMKTFGTVGKEERPSVEFLLTNYGQRPIKILGGDFSCSCLAMIDVPVVVPPNGSATLRLSVRAKRGPGSYSEWLRLVTDPAGPGVVLRVRGVFR